MFQIDKEEKARILKDFNINEKHYGIMLSLYEDIHKGMKEHYLAHMIRTMESRLKKITGNDLFQIVVQPFNNSENKLEVSCADYVPHCYFVIYYPQDLHGKQLRVQLAHELGHLFLIEYFNAQKEGGDYFDENTRTEPLSTLFGIFAIIDKNDYYQEKSYAEFLHTNRACILNDFKQLENRKDGILNLS